MLVSHRKKFVYIKTVKTAGTSVESYFEKYCMPKGEWEFTHSREQYVSDTGVIGYRGPQAKSKEWFNHMRALEIQNRLGKQVWDEYFKFCVIRNPFDKLVSLFFFRLYKGAIKFEKDDKPVQNFRTWLGTDVPVPDRNMYTISGQICIDYFIRYEDINAGVKHVCEQLGVPFRPERIPVLKAGFRDHSISLCNYYTEELLSKVAEAYAFEIEQFGFNLPKLSS